MTAKLSISDKDGKENVYIIDRNLVIGRSPQCDIYVDDTQASRQHCTIVLDANGYQLKDLGSHNGTQVNGQKVDLHMLQAGDKIKIGATVLFFDVGQESGDVHPKETPSPSLAEDTSGLPVLQIKQKKKALQTIPLQPGARYTLGRNEDNRIRVVDSQISANHAEVIWQNGAWFVHDLQSRNGVYVNGQKIIESMPLKPGDVFVLGETRCVFDMPSRARMTPACYSPLVPAMIALLVIGCAFFVAHKMLAPAKPYPVAAIPGNLVEDFSFEQGFAWQLQHGMSISHHVAKSGHASLMFCSAQPVQAATRDNDLVCEASLLDAISLPYGKAYQVSAWLRFSRLQGVAGIKLKWLIKHNNVTVTETYSPLVTGDATDWQRLEFIAYAPPVADQVKLFCFVAGRAENVHFDDVVLSEKNSALTGSKQHLENAPLCAHVDARGILEIYHGPHLVLANGKLLIWKKDKSLLANQAFAIGQTSRKQNTLGWHGLLYSLPDFSVCAELTSKCESIPDGLNWSISLQWKQSKPEYTADFVMTMPQEYGQRKVKLGGKSSATCHNSVPANVVQEISYLMWDAAWDKFGFFYPQPTVCSLNNSEQALFVRHQLPDRSPLIWEMQIRTNLLKESELLQEWNDSARLFEKQGEPGKATVLYQKIVDKFMFHPVAETARHRLQYLQQAFQQESAELARMADHARFFQSLPPYQELKAACHVFRDKWRESPSLAQLDELWGKIESEQQALQAEYDKRAVAYWTTLAQQHENERRWALASVCYQETLKYPSTAQPETIQNKLKDLQKLMATQEK